MKPCVYLHLFVFAHSFIQQTRLVPGVENLAGRRTGVALVLRNLTILFGKTNTNNKYKCTYHVQGYRGQEQPALSRNKAQTWSGRWTGMLTSTELVPSWHQGQPGLGLDRCPGQFEVRSQILGPLSCGGWVITSSIALHEHFLHANFTSLFFPLSFPFTSF